MFTGKGGCELRRRERSPPGGEDEAAALVLCALTGSNAADWQPIPGGITAPAGFRAAGITAGLKPSGKPDLSLLLAPEGAVGAGSFTTNQVRAACVDLCAERLAATGGRVRAVLTNSGQANACTGGEDAPTACGPPARWPNGSA